MSDAVPAWGPKKPPPSGDSEPPPKRKRYWWRFTLAAAIIVAVSAAATATSILLYLDSIAHALSHNNALGNRLQKYLSHVEGGAPENILIIGSDKRANLKEERGRSDTTILLRLDPEKDTIAVMSIPRDLKVEIPGVGTEKFNAAYAYGGPRLTLRVVKELTGLDINHFVNVDFLGFVRAVNAIKCVYTDVDRRYYHSNVGVPPSEQYSEINIQPGYQKLCGKEALEYVRYRHTDTDIVRSARQQDFISDARGQVSIKDLVFDQSGLIDIFTKYTSSDIDNTETMLEVLKLFIASRNASIKEIHFPAVLEPSYVTATPERIHEAVQMFLGSEASAGPRGSLEGEENEEGVSSGQKKAVGGHSAQKKAKKKKKKKKLHLKAKPPGDDGLVPAVEAGEAEGKAAARRVGGGFPIYYPTRLPSGAYFAETNLEEHVVDPRVYHVTDKDKEVHPAYRMVGIWELGDGPHYFGIQGIHGWEDPPILADPSVTETVHHRELEIFTDSGRIKLIAWRRGQNVYWVSNDLLETLSNDQMIGIATSAKVLLPKKPPRKRQAAGGG
jgi:polyisoprenyl-teichoic acid--peptidoglycan teichoic acid transferase